MRHEQRKVEETEEFRETKKVRRKIEWNETYSAGRIGPADGDT